MAIVFTTSQAELLYQGGLELQLNMLRAANHEHDPKKQREIRAEAEDLNNALIKLQGLKLLECTRHGG